MFHCVEVAIKPQDALDHETGDKDDNQLVRHPRRVEWVPHVFAIGEGHAPLIYQLGHELQSRRAWDCQLALLGAACLHGK
jgi:hypothetical protein